MKLSKTEENVLLYFLGEYNGKVFTSNEYYNASMLLEYYGLITILKDGFIEGSLKSRWYIFHHEVINDRTK